jgi:hypothetical protein
MNAVEIGELDSYHPQEAKKEQLHSVFRIFPNFKLSQKLSKQEKSMKYSMGSQMCLFKF